MNILGQYPCLGSESSKPCVEEIYQANGEWKIALVRFCYITYQVASSYFVCMIVVLRLLIIYNPMMVFSVKMRTAKICTAIIWCIAVFLNFLPILSSAGYDEKTVSRNLTVMRRDGLNISYDTKDGLAVGYITVANLGIVLPLFLTIFAYISMIIVLKNKKQKQGAGKDAKNSENFQKLINGLVIWLIVCNAPYIYWLHWVLFLYLEHGKLWMSAWGVI